VTAKKAPPPVEQKAGRKPLTPARRHAISERIRQVIEELGGKVKASAQLRWSERSIEGWLARDGSGAPDTAAVMAFAIEAQIAPQWLLFGTGPKHFGESRAQADLDADLRAVMRSRLIALGHEGWYVDRYLPSPAELLTGMVESAAAVMEQKRLNQRRHLADVLHAAIEQGAADGSGNVAAFYFAHAFADMKSKRPLPSSVEVHPEFSRAVSLEDGALFGPNGSHPTIRAQRKKR
jgi:hypothetical protein